MACQAQIKDIMKILFNIIVTITLLLTRMSLVNAQERILPVEERQAKLDSIIAETERHFGLNDDAHSAKDKYGAKAFKKMKYDENGVATITLPVIYRALGKAVEQSDKDEIVIKKLLGCTPSTSLEFLYRGNKYYIPLSCNNDIEVTPAENELIEVTIRLFNPKVFHYSKRTIPYPYCIVESINLLR